MKGIFTTYSFANELKYNTTLEELKLYNNIGELNVGDKIIIPQVND